MLEIFENLDFARNCRSSRFSWKYSKNLDFGWNFLEIYILVEIFKYLDFGRNFRKSRFWLKFLINLDFGWNFRKSGHWSKFTKIAILVEIFFFNLHFGRNFRKNLPFGRILGKSRFWSKFSKISILVEIFENLYFGRNFRKISISDDIFWKISILLKICDKSRIWSNIS